MNAQLPAPRPAPGQNKALTPATGIKGPMAGKVATASNGRRIVALSGQQKAAILVQVLLVEGADLNLSTLPEDMQSDLTEQMASMRLVDRDTMMAVVAEFVETLEQVGLSFPEGIDGALKALGGKLSPGAAGRLRRIARASGHADPWERIATAEIDALVDLLAPESIEVVAVVLSKLPVARAAELLGRMPGERARRIAFAIAQTEGVAPDVVARIGATMAAELDRKPPPVFSTAPAARVGAILNSVHAELRDSLLDSLDREDASFADGVRKAIFTFGHIPDRVETMDVPRLMREIDQPRLITALAYALPQGETAIGRAATFILDNVSQRMAASLRDEIEGVGKVRDRDGEAALADVVAAVRRLADAGELALREPEDE